MAPTASGARKVGRPLLALIGAGALVSIILGAGSDTNGNDPGVETISPTPITTTTTEVISAVGVTTTSTAATSTTTTTIPSVTTISTSVIEDEPRSFTIAATGDLLIHGPVARKARTTEGWDFTPMFSKVAPILRNADLSVCHVESPMSLNNAKLSYYPRFRVPNQLAEAIADAGYDTCSLASNHANDGGRDGVVGTIEALDRAGVAHTGMARTPAERDRLNLLDANGATVAHLSYTYGLNTGRLPAEETYLANVIDEAAILDEARRARAAGADFVIISLHWGSEYIRRPNAFQTDLGPRLLASPDIDLILGHHAHVVQPVAEINGEYLVYGLGNFLSNQSHLTCQGCPPGTQDGVIVNLTVTEDEATGRWLVSAVAHTPTWVDLTTFEIVDVLTPGGGYDPTLLAESAGRTAAALSALGTALPVAHPVTGGQ